MNLVTTMVEYRREGSWAVWEVNAASFLTGQMAFPVDQAEPALSGRTMFVSLNPGRDWPKEPSENTAD